MDAAITEILIGAVAKVGEEVAIEILHAITGGDVDTVAELSKVLPDEHQIILRDEALIAQQTAKAHASTGIEPASAPSTAMDAIPHASDR